VILISSINYIYICFSIQHNICRYKIEFNDAMSKRGVLDDLFKTSSLVKLILSSFSV
jgi:hypothetical protein